MYESISFKAQGHIIEFLNEFPHPVTSDNLSAVELTTTTTTTTTKPLSPKQVEVG